VISYIFRFAKFEMRTLDVVLERCTRDQQPRSGVETLQSFIQLRLAILQTMSLPSAFLLLSLSETYLINSERLPFNLPQILPIFQDELIGSQQDIESQILERPKFEFSDDFP